METANQSPAADKVQEILVNVVLDRSGSMGGVKQSTISGYNEYLNGIKADKETKYNISLIQFDSPGDNPELTVSYMDKPLAEVPDLDEKTYQPRGGTPLYDAIGECVRRVEAKGRGVITVIITDGQENSSKEFSNAAIKSLITGKEAEGWKFIFLGANIDSAAVGGSLGIAAQACANYQASAAGVHGTFTAMASSNMRYAADARTVGLRAANGIKSFFEEERDAMMGGRPAAPPPFRPNLDPLAALRNTAATKKREWNVTNEVPSA